MSDRVTLYLVRRPDGTVIEAPLRDHRYSAVISASYSEPQLSNLILAADEDQKFDDYLKTTGYTIEPVEYAPLPSEEARKAVHSALLQLDYDAQRNPISRQFNPADALSELERIWGK